MSDQDAPQERPAYREACEAMSFGELRGFVDRALEAVRSGDPGDGAPRTEEEFLALADMLDAKLEAARAELPAAPPMPEHPAGYDPDIPSYSRGEFRQSTELWDMESELMSLNSRIERARYDRDLPEWNYDQMTREARELRRQIPRREEEERRSWPERYAAHEKVRSGYERAVRGCAQEAQRISKRIEILKRQREFVERIRRAIGATFGTSAGAPTGRLRWRPFRAAEPTPANIRGHYREHLRRQGKADTFDQRRLDAALALPYEDWYVPEEGFGGFDAYGVFTFRHTAKVLLECPIWGNAAYVVEDEQGAWKDMTKRAMVDSGLAKQIPHRGENWPAKIRRALDLE